MPSEQRPAWADIGVHRQQGADVARVCAFLPGRLAYLREGTVWEGRLRAPAGYYVPMRDEAALACVIPLIDEARARAVDEASRVYPAVVEPMRALEVVEEKHYRSVLRLLDARWTMPPAGSWVGDSVDFYDRAAHPVIPFTDDGGVSLNTGRPLSADEVAELRVSLPPMCSRAEWEASVEVWEDVRRRIPDLSAVPETAEECEHDDGMLALWFYLKQWGEPVLERAAWRLREVRHCVDFIGAVEGGAGKGTQVEAMRAAVGSVHVDDRPDAFSAAGNRYSQVSQFLTNRLVVVMDEAGRDQVPSGLPNGLLKSLTTLHPVIERKRENVVVADRMANAVITFANYPKFDGGSQEYQTRFKWAFIRNDITDIGSAVHLRLVDARGDAVRWLRVELVYRAMRHATLAYADSEALTHSQETRACVAELFRVNEPKIDEVLREHVRCAEGHTTYTSSAVRVVNDWLREETRGSKQKAKAVSPNEVGHALRRLFYEEVKAGRVTWEHAREGSRWHGLQLIEPPRRQEG